jgi:hypothetical protein
VEHHEVTLFTYLIKHIPFLCGATNNQPGGIEVLVESVVTSGSDVVADTAVTTTCVAIISFFFVGADFFFLGITFSFCFGAAVFFFDVVLHLEDSHWVSVDAMMCLHGGRYR